jgi:hypothetical protein
VLLIVHAWFDVTNAASGTTMELTIVDALVIELALALLGLWAARHSDAVSRWCQLLRQRVSVVHGKGLPSR